jgi:hypothetical protein
VSDEAARRTVTLDAAPDHTGRATVAATTVAHDRGEPVSAHVIATTPSGQRVVARGDDRDLAASVATEEWVGREIRVAGNRIDA